MWRKLREAIVDQGGPIPYSNFSKEIQVNGVRSAKFN